MRLENRRISKWLYNRYATGDRKAIDAAVAQDARFLRYRHQVADGIPA